MEYLTFNDAYRNTLKDVFNNPEFFNAPRGFKSREKLAYSFSISDPTQRVFFGKRRETNIIFNFAEALWYLSDNNRLDYISYYNKRMPEYSMDHRILTGTAYGPKIFEFGNAKINQWQKVKEILRTDKDSKRAFIQIFDSSELLVKDNIDVSCTLGFQFFIRDGHLHMISYMRANDAFRGMISDVFSFTFIQELMARELGLKVGKFYHSVGSIHIYEADNRWVNDVLQDKSGHSFRFPEMPAENIWENITKLMNYENLLRSDNIGLTLNDIEKIVLPNYWKQVLILFCIYQSIYYDREIDVELYMSLLPVYQYFVHNKWNVRVERALNSAGENDE